MKKMMDGCISTCLCGNKDCKKEGKPLGLCRSVDSKNTCDPDDVTANAGRETGFMTLPED